MSELARAGAPDRGARVCLAEQQTAGRGRRGRAWISPPGGNLYLSVSWSFAGGAELLQGLSLAVGVVLCDALEQHGASGLSLKWPNDALRHGRKLAGILVEVQTTTAGTPSVIIGVGINVRVPPFESAAIEQPWADLRDINLSRNELAAAFLDRLLPLLACYADTGFEPFRRPWEARHAHANRLVTIEQAGELTVGRAAGVDGTGALMLETAEGTLTIHGGEVSLRLQS